MKKPKEALSDALELFEGATIKTARRYLVAKAADVRKSVKASLKSGGKNRFSRTYQTSKPGEPPKTHGARLKQSIRYDVETPDLIKVGAPSIAGSRTANILEKGGAGKITSTKTADAYFERRKKNARKSAKAETPKPTARRAYYLESESGQTRRVSKYERFKSEEKGKRAASAPDFQTWRASIQKTKATETRVQPRPFVKPAAEKESDRTKERERWARIVRAAQRNAR